MGAVIAYRKYGVKPTIISWLMKNSDTITHYRDCLDKYFKLYWEGKYLLSKIQSGIIRKDNVDYLAVFSRYCSRGYIVANPNVQYAVSFRQAQAEYNLSAYCYISVANSPEWN